MRTKIQLFSGISEHLLHDVKPSLYINDISNEGLFSEHPFSMLDKMKETMQSPKHHPEGSVWNHTMMVTDAAADAKMQSSSPKVFMWAALLHDIGKPETTKTRNGKITSYDHEKFGANMAKTFLSEFTDDNDFIQKTVSLIRWHMQILFVVNSLQFADIKSMKEETNIDDVALLGLCDRIGRLGSDRKKEEQNINLFLRICKK